MSIKQLHIYSLLGALVFLVLGVFLSGLIIDSLTTYFKSSLNISFVSYSINGQFKFRFYFATSFACIFVLNWLLLLSIKEFKNRKLSFLIFCRSVGVLLAAFIIGAINKILLLVLTVSHATSYSTSNDTLQYESLSFNQFALIATIFVAFIIYLTTKKQEKEVG